LKYVLVVGDGMADESQKELRGPTPLEVSRTPNMDFYAERRMVGLVRTVPQGMAPRRDVANMSLLGYSPQTDYTGVAPLEAASMDLELGPDDVASRCNLVLIFHRNSATDITDPVPSSWLFCARSWSSLSNMP
jgi:2,3-bisphosphoglycerate-independent phosphoglycerate mutase